MKYIIAKFFGWIFLLFGYFTAVGIIGIPFLVLGSDLISYSERKGL